MLAYFVAFFFYSLSSHIGDVGLKFVGTGSMVIILITQGKPTNNILQIFNLCNSHHAASSKSNVRQNHVKTNNYILDIGSVSCASSGSCVFSGH